MQAFVIQESKLSMKGHKASREILRLLSDLCRPEFHPGAERFCGG